ncbi:MAG: hypothetical protein MI861_24000, partial [Pirellulales bacterium]|nr:hypothetical protein [Pirellulales bacterium]
MSIERNLQVAILLLAMLLGFARPGVAQIVDIPTRPLEQEKQRSRQAPQQTDKPAAPATNQNVDSPSDVQPPTLNSDPNATIDELNQGAPPPPP